MLQGTLYVKNAVYHLCAEKIYSKRLTYANVIGYNYNG